MQLNVKICASKAPKELPLLTPGSKWDHYAPPTCVTSCAESCRWIPSSTSYTNTKSLSLSNVKCRRHQCEYHRGPRRHSARSLPPLPPAGSPPLSPVAMSPWGRLRAFFLNDEELSKKDDDHIPTHKNGGLRASNWHPARGPPRRSIKRIAIVLGITCLVYLFIHNIPTDLGPSRTGRPHYGGSQGSHNTQSEASPKHVSQHVTDPEVASFQERNYNGPPKFVQLAATLQAVSGTTRGGMIINQNILFAASSLKSAATLLPIACQMGTELKNYVHFALMSRSGIEMKELQKLNGIDEGCQIIFHGMDSPQLRLVSGYHPFWSGGDSSDLRYDGLANWP